MTSLEIAELTGKQHKNVMQAIRNMEPAWEKIAGLKFQLGSYEDANGQLRPCYSLTKTECLYIATKFNDEARAKLVLRWEELERRNLTPNPSPVREGSVRCLPSPKEILALADDIIGKGLRMLNEDAEDTLTATQVAKTFNMTVYDFNQVVCNMGIQYRRGGRWNIAEELKPYIERLDSASGLIECPQAKKLSLDIKQENTDAAKLYDSDAYEVLSYRANVIAWLKGMVLYVAHGYKWSKEIADFVRWSEKYNLWCKMLYFVEQLEKELREEVEIQRQSGPKNLLDLLPDEFTKDQYQQMRMSQGKSGDGESTLRTWQTRGYIIFDDVSNRYCKTEEYLKRGSV